MKESKKQHDNSNDNDGNEMTTPLTTAQMQSAFYSFMFGVCLSFLSFAIEAVKLFSKKIYQLNE